MSELASNPACCSILCTYKVVANEELKKHIAQRTHERNLNEISFTGTIPHPGSEDNIQAWRNSIRRMMQHEVFNIDILKIWMEWQNGTGVQKSNVIYNHNTDMSSDKLKTTLDSTNASSACFEITIKYVAKPQFEDASLGEDVPWPTSTLSGDVGIWTNSTAQGAPRWPLAPSVEDVEDEEEHAVGRNIPVVTDGKEPPLPPLSLSVHGSPASANEWPLTTSPVPLHPLTKRYLDCLAQPSTDRDDLTKDTLIDEMTAKMVFHATTRTNGSMISKPRYGGITHRPVGLDGREYDPASAAKSAKKVDIVKMQSIMHGPIAARTRNAGNQVKIDPSKCHRTTFTKRKSDGSDTAKPNERMPLTWSALKEKLAKSSLGTSMWA